MQTSKRILWLDWMKVIGMFFIIWGHLFPEPLVPFIYSFSVPVFFVLSGFLTNHSEVASKGINKICKGLVLPYILIAFSNICIYAIFAKSVPIDLPEKVAGILLGVQSYTGAMWFVYTLILLKVIVLIVGNLCKSSKLFWSIMGVICILCVVGMILWNQLDYEILTCAIRDKYPDFQVLYKGKITWAYSNILCAFPFFMFGMSLRTTKDSINRALYHIKAHRILALCCVVALIVTLYYLSRLNGPVWVYLCEYGNNLLLCYLNVIIGTIVIFIVAILLENKWVKWVTLLSTGNIIVLGFHGIPLNLTMLKCPGITVIGGEIFGTFIYSLCLYLCFIPVIVFTKKYVPIFVGGKK